MPFPFWLHCNACGCEYKSNFKFYLLNCQHVICVSCLRKTGGKRCPIDSKEAQHIELQKLPKKLNSYFEPAEDALKVALNAMKFQQEQQCSRMKFIQSYEDKNKRASQQVASLRVKVHAKRTELTKLRDRRIKMQQKLKEIYETNQKKSPSMIHRSSGVLKTPSSVASSVSPASAFTSTPLAVRPVFGFSPSSGTSTVRTVTNAGFFDHNGPFMKKVREYKEIYSQKGSQKSHSSSRKPFFA